MLIKILMLLNVIFVSAALLVWTNVTHPDVSIQMDKDNFILVKDYVFTEKVFFSKDGKNYKQIGRIIKTYHFPKQAVIITGIAK